MPNEPSYLDRIPQALQILAVEDKLLTRAEVGLLLGLAPRRTIDIMKVAGAEMHGKALKVRSDLLAEYLATKVTGDVLRKERERQRRFAEWLSRANSQAYCRVEVTFPMFNYLSQADRFRLPPGVNLGASRLTVDFDDDRDLLEKLRAIGVALGKDYGVYAYEVEQIPPKDAKREVA